MVFDLDQVIAGEFWRAFTFLFVPITMSPIFVIFALYLFYLFGNALEKEWGTFRYNLYVWIAVLMSLISALFVPGSPPASMTINSTVFFAFAWLVPNFTIMLFFVFPVKIKYLAMLAWFFVIFAFMQGIASRDWATVAATVASVANFLIWFGSDILWWIKMKFRGAVERDRKAKEAEIPFHRCTACKRTEKTDPRLDFRYFKDNDGKTRCYCEDHFPASVG
jgi:hypothetical protein